MSDFPRYNCFMFSGVPEVVPQPINHQLPPTPLSNAVEEKTNHLL